MARTGGLPLPTITDDRVLGEAVIQKSLRCRSGASTYLSRTPSSAGDRRTFTISMWVKRGTIGSGAMFGSWISDSDRATFRFSSDYLEFQDTGSSASVKTDAVFRDTTNWYHVVAAIDTTQGTQSNRGKLYVNGVQQSLSSNNFTQNVQTSVNNNSVQVFGTRWISGANSNFDGYLAEINLIDGQQLDASYFGFTDSQTGIWMPKRYEGTYGTNGVRLDFLDNSSTAALGIDKSPNGNDFASTNFSVSASLTNDSMPDTPTNNFCVLNHLNKTTSFTGKDGGLTFDQTSNDQAITGTFFVTSGKWYWEFYKNSGHNPEIGIATVGETTLNQRSDGFISGRLAFISNGGNLRTGSSSTTSITGGSSQTGAGWLRIACDMDNKKIWFSDLSGNYFNSGNPATGANPAYDFSSHATADGWAPYICLTTANDANGYPNFGQFDLNSFSSNIPSGFKTLTAKNLRDELLTNPSIVRQKRHFDTILYTGNASTQKITGLEFKPDMIWFKSRTSTSTNGIADSVRGRSKLFYPDTTQAEETSSSTRDLVSFDDGGFTLGNPQILSSTNGNGLSIVAWCWKAGGAAVSNTDGTITSQVSANTEAGFSIVSFTGNATSGATVGHGLNATPKWFIIKERGNTNDWVVYHESLGSSSGNTNVQFLNLTNDIGGGFAGGYNNTAPTSSVFSLGNSTETNRSSGNFIAYCWAEVPGFSKFGSYTGNGNSDGTFVELGFRPAWVLVKRTDSAENWVLKDSARNTFNDVFSNLNPNTSNAEFGSAGDVNSFDFVSNGFKIQGSNSAVNASGGTFIFMAFAEQPGVLPFTTMTNAR